MRYARLFVFTVLITVSTASVILATGNGDVTIRANGGYAHLIMCEGNLVEIWMQNDAPIWEMSIGLSITSVVGALQFSPQWGTAPAELPVLRIEAAAQGTFDLSFEVDVSQLPDAISIHGLADQNPMPVHSTLTRVYSLLIYVPEPAGGDTADGICIDNIVSSLTGEWSFNDGTAYAPTFNGQPNSGILQPDAPPLCFEVLNRPSIPPQFTATPQPVEMVGLCDTFTFEFEAVDDNTPAIGFWFSCAAGTIDSLNGAYLLPPSGAPDTVQEIVTVHSYAGCNSTDYAFQVIRSSGQPQIAHCQPMFRVKSGTIRQRDYDIASPLQCAPVLWSLLLQSGTSPLSLVTIDPMTGVVTVDAAVSDEGQVFDYLIVAELPEIAVDSCQFELRVLPCVAGDSDNNGVVTISDVVYIVNYIFGSQQPPGCEESLDADCNGIVSMSDAVYLINFIFAGGPEPC